jgi:hypothetical protein
VAGKPTHHRGHRGSQRKAKLFPLLVRILFVLPFFPLRS